MKIHAPFLFLLFLPPLYATLPFLIAVAAQSGEFSWEFLGALPLFLPFAYLVAGLPSLGFALIMRCALKTQPTKGKRLVLAALLGLACGFLIGVVLGGHGLSVMIPLGLATGLLVEATTMTLDHPRPRPFL